LIENSQPDTAAEHRQRHDRSGEKPGRQWGDQLAINGEDSVSADTRARRFGTRQTCRIFGQPLP